MELKSTLILVFSAILISNHEINGQSFADQVHNFFQKSVIKPIRATVQEGVQEVSGIISHYANISSNFQQSIGLSNPNNDSVSSSTPSLYPTTNTPTDSSTISREVLSSTTESSSTTPTSVTSDSSPTIDIRQGNPGGQTTEQSQILNTTATPMRNETWEPNYLDENAVSKLKELCPELENMSDPVILRYRFFQPKDKCFMFNFKGPCGDKMKFYIKEEGSIYGQCECRDGSRIHIYHEETNSCFEIFSRAYCPEGQWLDLTREGKPICSINPCFANGTNFVQVNGTCAEIDADISEVCGPNLFVGFVNNKRTAECVTRRVINSPGILPCSPGSSIAIHGKCHVSEWEFGDDGEEESKDTKNG